MRKIIVTVCVKNEDKILMVQEAQLKAYKLWNFPAGNLDENEKIFEAAKREAKEETGYDVELLSLLSIQNFPKDNLIRVIFNASIISGNINYDTNEILDVKWISIEEIESMTEQLRGPDSILDIINDLKKNKEYPLYIVKNIM